MKQLENIIKMFIIIAVVISLLSGITIGYYYAQLNNTYKNNFDRFRELYHNDYIATIQLFIQKCSEVSDGGLSVVRHFVGIRGNNLGIIYRCDSTIPNNLSLDVRYTQQFYELK